MPGGQTATAQLRAPRTGQVMGTVPLLREADVPHVARTAQEAFHSWRNVPTAERCRSLSDLADHLAQRLPELAGDYSREHGKTVAEATVELTRAVETLRWNAEEAERVTRPSGPAVRGELERWLEVEPVGPVLAIVPWNFPAVVLARKLGPALAMGCSVVVKGPEETPGVVGAFAEAALAAGLPDGLVQVVHAGPDVAEELVRHRVFGTVSFTGSTRVGRLVAAAAAANPTPCVLELGGHAPALVTPEADLELAVRALAAAKFGSTGQSCAAPSRLLVHRSVHDDFVARLVAAAPAPDNEAHGTMGPLNNARHRNQVHALVHDAVGKGAHVALGGRMPAGPGHYYPATVLTRVPASARILSEEPFGPVAPVMGYDDEETAIDMANDCDFALSAYVFGEPAHAHRLGKRLNAGSVSVNCAPGAPPDAPLGGRKASGYGYEGGDQGMLAFGRLKIMQGPAAHRSEEAEAL